MRSSVLKAGPVVAALAIGLSACGGGGGGGAGGGGPQTGVTTPTPPATPQFTWNNSLKAGATVSVSGVGMESSATAQNVWSAPVTVDVTYTQTMGADGAITSATLTSPLRTAAFAASNGGAFTQEDANVRMTKVEQAGPLQGYMSATGLVSDPLVSGWSYQSFGVWRGVDGVFERTAVVAASVGSATPNAALPSTGSAQFSGRLLGHYVMQDGVHRTVAGDVTLNASFANRSVTLASGPLSIPGPQNGKTLTGVLAYAPGQNRLSGAVSLTGSTLTGSATAQFYGPAAEEIGGAMALTTPDGASGRLTAAFGAKR